jgi:hypothetical protein
MRFIFWTWLIVTFLPILFLLVVTECLSAATISVVRFGRRVLRLDGALSVALDEQQHVE